MEELNEYTEKEESNFDLKAEIFKYLTHWKWLVFGLLVGGLVAYLYNRYTIPEYRSEASMMIVNDQEKNVMSALPSEGRSLLTFNESGVENQIETLRSKRLVETVIDELDQNIAYYIEGNVITVEAYKNSPIRIEFITPDSIVQRSSASFFVTPTGNEKFILQEEDTEYSKVHRLGELIHRSGLDFKIIPRTGYEDVFAESNPVNIRLRPIREVANTYISKLQIGLKGKAKDILSLSMVQESSKKSEDFLNALMIKFNENGMADKQEVARNTAAFIQERLNKITEDLDSVEGHMVEFKKENRIMDVSTGAEEFKTRYSEAEKEIFDLQTQLSLLESVKELLNKERAYKLLPSNIGIQESEISGLIGQYNTIVLERNEYLKSATPQNPTVQTLTDQLNSLENNLQESIETAVSNINIRLKELSKREQSAEGQFSSFPGLEKGIRGIERQQQIKEELYLFLLQRREEAAISRAATSSVARVIDPAYTINEPVDPKPWLILVGGFLVGLIIPILVIFVKNLLDTKVHHKGDLQPVIKHIPFLGEIPRIDKEDEQAIQVNDRSPLAESFRILRTNLAYLIQNKTKDKGEIIFVTSTIKGEGKTFVSYNLARTLASTKKKVLLIGADIRNPKLHRYAHLEGLEKGLSDFLYDYDVKEEDIISKSSEGSIDVDLVLSGAIPPNPAELFMSDRMGQLLNHTSQHYDYVIVDTAPVMIVTDTLLISPLADTTLYITRAEFTEKKLLEFPKELKQQGKLKGVAIILNDVDYSKFSYGAKYGYAYGYGYGYGADEESKWKKWLKNPFKRS